MTFPSVFGAMFGNRSGNGTTVISQNAEQCPYCGGPALTENVTVTVKNHVVSVARSGWATRENVVQLYEIYQGAQEQQISPEIAVERAAEISPEAAITLRDWLSYGPA